MFLAAEVRGQIHQSPDPIISRRINMFRINISNVGSKTIPFIKRKPGAMRVTPRHSSFSLHLPRSA